MEESHTKAHLKLLALVTCKKAPATLLLSLTRTHIMVGMRGAYGGGGGGGGHSNANESRPLGRAATAVAAPMTTSTEIASMAVHKVAPPPPQSTASKMKARVKETFFPDDTFRGFKGQPLGTQGLMAVKYLFPILDWLPSYSFSLFKSDLISGLTIASLAIPQARICYSLFHASASPP